MCEADKIFRYGKNCIPDIVSRGVLSKTHAKNEGVTDCAEIFDGEIIRWQMVGDYGQFCHNVLKFNMIIWQIADKTLLRERKVLAVCEKYGLPIGNGGMEEWG